MEEVKWMDAKKNNGLMDGKKKNKWIGGWMIERKTTRGWMNGNNNNKWMDGWKENQ